MRIIDNLAIFLFAYKREKRDVSLTGLHRDWKCAWECQLVDDAFKVGYKASDAVAT